MRFAVFVRPGAGSRRVGRIVQRLCEVETYRAMSMLGLMRSRQLTGQLNALDPRLAALVGGMDATEPSPETALHNLLAISAELESLAVKFSFRFGATAAYEAILNQRVQVLREERVVAAGCVLPLADELPDHERNLGTRHRAALGGDAGGGGETQTNIYGTDGNMGNALGENFDAGK